MTPRHQPSSSALASAPWREIALAVGLVLLLAGIAAAQAGFTDDDEASQKTYWQEKYRTVRQEIATVKQRLEINRLAISNARQRGYPRGEARDKLYAWVAEDEARLPELEQELQDLEVEAKQAGALPGWFREVEDEAVDVAPASPDAGVRGVSATDEGDEAAPELAPEYENEDVERGPEPTDNDVERGDEPENNDVERGGGMSLKPSGGIRDSGDAF